MNTDIIYGKDAIFADDFLIKEGSLGKWEDLYKSQSPIDWYDNWDKADPTTIFTADCSNWRAYYKNNYPLTFYHNKKFVLGIRKPPSKINIEYNTKDIIWADISGKVILERGDFPRFTTKDVAKFSFTPIQTQIPNVFKIGNGYSIACNKNVKLIEYGIVTEGEVWWMIGPEDLEEDLSRQVLTVKIYDGPYKYQAHGTDIVISDPSPVDKASEYTIYSYDEDGLRGLYKEEYVGVSPQKYALTIRGEDLENQIVSSNGEYRLVEDQLSGKCTVRYKFPLNATKLLSVYVRGSEVEWRIRPDNEDWVSFENYDGKALVDLEVELDVYSSLSSIRLEWESVKNWTPVGRPKIDIIPADWGGNQLRISADEGEGLSQTVDLYSGAYTISANVKCQDREVETITPQGKVIQGEKVGGHAIIDVGGIEIVNWYPYDKNTRGAGNFVSNHGQYEMTLTTRERGVYTIDRIRIAEMGQDEWIQDDIKWSLETDNEMIDIGDSINIPELPVSIQNAKKWKLNVEAPKNLGGVDHIAISNIQTDSYQTGEDSILYHLRWQGDGQSRVYLPRNIIRNPVNSDYIEVDGYGSVSWEQDSREDDGDVKAQIAGSEFEFRDNYSYRDFSLKNRRWKVDFREFDAKIFLDGKQVAVLEGKALPFRVVENNREDIQVDCPEGLFQMRREIGPRFDGWKLDYSTVPYQKEGAKIVFGTSEEEAIDNLAFYRVQKNN